MVAKRSLFSSQRSQNMNLWSQITIRGHQDQESTKGILRLIEKEKTVALNNVPTALTNLRASLGSVSMGNWYEINLMSLISRDGTYSLRISSTSSDGADYYSREGTNLPQLVITVQ